MLALACSETRPGVILLKGSHCDLVLSARSDGLSFSVVGQALVVNGYSAFQSRDFPQCTCRNEHSLADYKHEFVKLALDPSDRDAIAAIGCWDMIVDTDGDTNISILTFLNHHSLGRLTKDAVAYDITTHDFGTARNIAPSKALCERHQAAERYRMARHAFMYNLVTRDGIYVAFSK